jgi:hypothetical protein
MPDLDTVVGVEAELKREEDVHEKSRKALLEGYQSRRKHLRALLAVLQDREAK